MTEHDRLRETSTVIVKLMLYGASICIAGVLFLAAAWLMATLAREMLQVLAQVLETWPW